MLKNVVMRPVFLVLLLSLVGLGGCEGVSASKTVDVKNQKNKEYRYGSLASDEGGFDLLGGKDRKEEGSGLTVNAYLWRAALDTVAFMPIISADPFGGVILTDWYAEPTTPDERLKLNVFILDRELRADGVRVKTFKQKKDSSGAWLDQAVADSVGASIEDTILTRARQMRLRQREAGG